jgi:hypothetical protein
MKENRMEEDLLVGGEPLRWAKEISPRGWSTWCALRTVRSCSRWRR